MKKIALTAVLIGAAFVLPSGVHAQCCAPNADTVKKECFTKVDTDKNAVASQKERTKYCKKMLKCMDSDKNKEVTKAEYMANSEKTFTARDANADGFIVIEEYIVLPEGMDSAKIATEKKNIEDKQGKDSTKKIDSNKDKSVTPVEYVVFFYTILDDADTDKDGKVSKDEFMKHSEGRFQKADKNNDGAIVEEELIEDWNLEPEKK
ncbi:MAG: hypothetical protein A2020_01465 [Lentisphaerae bacterium GWF2_45_14]|nr:MAG: hypothetical protein A2020_01465 [Lentisphaerae bacterium GWF2_45_14]